MSHRFFIASHDQQKAKQLRSDLIGQGHVVTSRWITDDERFDLGMDVYTLKELAYWACINVEDVIDATAGVILIAEPHSQSGGKHVETGIALGLGRSVFVLGEIENIFHHHPRCHVCPTTFLLLDRIMRYA